MRLHHDMRQLTEHLRDMQELRMEALTALRTDARRSLEELRRSRHEMTAALAGRLAQLARDRRTAERRRLAEAAEAAKHRGRYLAHLRTSVASMRASTASTLEEFHRAMREAHRTWAEFCAAGRVAPTAATEGPTRTPAPRGGRSKRATAR